MKSAKRLCIDEKRRPPKTQAELNRELVLAFAQVLIACLLLMFLSYLLIKKLHVHLPADKSPVSITNQFNR